MVTLSLDALILLLIGAFFSGCLITSGWKWSYRVRSDDLDDVLRKAPPRAAGSVPPTLRLADHEPATVARPARRKPKGAT